MIGCRKLERGRQVERENKTRVKEGSTRQCMQQFNSAAGIYLHGGISGKIMRYISVYKHYIADIAVTR
jgi:hypothetical protein